MADQPSTSSGHRARLRQRLFDGGGKALLDHELVEYLLALAIPRRDTKAQAKALIARFGGIGALLEAGPDVLRKEGLSEGVIGALQIARATALRLLETRIEDRPVLSSWDALGDYLQAAMAHSSVEEVRVLFLNAKNMTDHGPYAFLSSSTSENSASTTSSSALAEAASSVPAAPASGCA